MSRGENGGDHGELTLIRESTPLSSEGYGPGPEGLSSGVEVELATVRGSRLCVHVVVRTTTSPLTYLFGGVPVRSVHTLWTPTRNPFPSHVPLPPPPDGYLNEGSPPFYDAPRFCFYAFRREVWLSSTRTICGGTAVVGEA